MSIKNNILYLTSKIFSYININLIILILFLFLFIKSSAIAYNTNNSGVVFMYHRFGESDYPSTNITLKQFEEHLNEFSKEKYNVVSLEFMIDAFNTKTDLKENTIAISVDDGYRSIITEAWPRMKKYGFPLTVFISTEPIDAKINGYLSWDEIRILKNEGVTIGAHTKSHPKLHELTNDQIKNEIEHANKRYLDELNIIPRLFAYPFGETSENVMNIIKDYKFSASFGQHSGVINDTSDFNYLPRFSLNEKYGDIERVRFAANSKGLAVYDLIPNNPLLNENPPFIGFSLVEKDLVNSLNCFLFDASGLIEHDKYLFSERIEIRLKRKIQSGRVRMNCTALNSNNKWMWFGHQFIMPKYLN